MTEPNKYHVFHDDAIQEIHSHESFNEEEEARGYINKNFERDPDIGAWTVIYGRAIKLSPFKEVVKVKFD